MGWTKTARREHDRSGLRYASDCTDEEWAVVYPSLKRTSRVGRPRKHKARTLLDAIQYIAATGCQSAQLPKDFLPFTTVQYHFYRMRDNGLLDAVNAVFSPGIWWIGSTMNPSGSDVQILAMYVRREATERFEPTGEIVRRHEVGEVHP